MGHELQTLVAGLAPLLAVALAMVAGLLVGMDIGKRSRRPWLFHASAAVVVVFFIFGKMITMWLSAALVAPGAPIRPTETVLTVIFSFVAAVGLGTAYAMYLIRTNRSQG